MNAVLLFWLAVLTVFFLSHIVVTARRFDTMEGKIKASRAGLLLPPEVGGDGLGMPTPPPRRAPHASVGTSPWCDDCKLARDHPLHLLSGR